MRKGDTGAAVSELQRLLNDTGLKVTVDGWYGDGTEAAVLAFQKRVGLVADGEAGPKTLAALRDRVKDPRRLTQADLERAAQRLGVPVAAVMAVNAVESSGNGFLPDGRPVILFERHVLYGLLEKAGADAEALAAKYPAVINPKRGGYVGGVGEWGRVATARQVTADYPSLVNEACSWGQFQIMGYHWQALGYESCADFVLAMCESEGKQLDAFIRFIESEPALQKALKARKWADFAKGYNGPDYKANLYDTKLAAAFERFSALAEEAPA